MKDVAVVICNYNKKEYALNCINSVFVSDFTDFDLFVVDNASTDGSADAMRERFGDKLTILLNGENLGGSGGFNRGMTYAMERGYRYIHLLDNDVVVDKDAVGALYGFMEAHDDAGVCGSLILRADRRERIQEFGAKIDWLDAIPLFGGELYDETLPPYLRCDCAASCSAMYRAEALRKTGAMDAGYFIYWDDVALSLGIRAIGLSVYACSESRVWHHCSFVKRTVHSRYYAFRNKIHALTKYLNDEDFEKLPSVLTERLFRMFAANRHNPEIIQAYFNAFDDALNGIRGKVDDRKIAARTKARELPPAAEAVYVPHVLDAERYDRSKAYVDSYQNTLFGDDDFNFVENMDSHYSFFRDVFEGYTRNKIGELRDGIKNGKY